MIQGIIWLKYISNDSRDYTIWDYLVKIYKLKGFKRLYSYYIKAKSYIMIEIILTYEFICPFPPKND